MDVWKDTGEKWLDSSIYKPPGLGSAIPSDGIAGFTTKFLLRSAHHWNRLGCTGKSTNIILKFKIISSWSLQHWWNLELGEMCGCFQTFHCNQPWHNLPSCALVHLSFPLWPCLDALETLFSFTTLNGFNSFQSCHSSFFFSPTHCRFLEQSLYGEAAEHFWQVFPQILWKSQPPGLVPYFECSCLALAQREHICQLSQDINIHIVSHPLPLAFKPWEY